MSEDSERKTGFLGLPDAQPMEDRTVSSPSDMVGEDWLLQVTVGEHALSMGLPGTILVGRLVEDDAPGMPILDLTPFDAYRNGVSRRHATITLKDGYLYIEDHGSTNGTRINGFQLTPNRRYRLRNGDQVEFSRLLTTVRFVPQR